MKNFNCQQLVLTFTKCFFSFFTERKLVDSIQSHFARILEEFDLTDVIDVLVSKKCITPAQHRKVRETEGNLGIEKVSFLSGINF